MYWGQSCLFSYIHQIAPLRKPEAKEARRRQSLAIFLWTHRKGENAGIGKIMWGKIMRSFYDFARHDFAAVFIRYRECRLDALSRKALIIVAAVRP